MVVANMALSSPGADHQHSISAAAATLVEEWPAEWILRERPPASRRRWSPATDGLRNLTGRVNRNGTATIWAITSTVSGNGDQGADPNPLVMITDDLAAMSLPAGERFETLRTARFAEVLRGVSFTPGTDSDERREADARSDDDRR
jgi:hypothetical protein